MNVKKPEQPSCSNLTARQWKNIVDHIEYLWDIKSAWPRKNSQDILRDISTLSVFSLITPIEAMLLRRYNIRCEVEALENIGKLIPASKYEEVSK